MTTLCNQSKAAFNNLAALLTGQLVLPEDTIDDVFHSTMGHLAP